jgi:hypothetical protein
MKNPIIIEGPPFDWDKGQKCLEQAVDDKGDVNWFAAFNADPGVMACPNCGIHLWNEGKIVKCPDCGHQWETNNYPQTTTVK